MDRLEGFWAGAARVGSGHAVAKRRDALGSWEAVEAATESDMVAVGLRADVARAIRRAAPVDTMGSAIPLSDIRYPPLLARMRSPPPVIFVQGEPQCLHLPAVAVVGTRNCTSYGAGVAQELGRALANAGACVVSGLARGIDGHAHRGALRSGKTAAVLAHGLEHTAPPSNRALRAAVVQSGGALVTTHLDGVAPRPEQFADRNRWIAGLASSVIVVEAPARSGARITAGVAVRAGRDVFAVPGPLGASASVGCLELLREGANVVANIPDLVADLVGGYKTSSEPWLNAVLCGHDVDAVARQFGQDPTWLRTRLTSMELAGELIRDAAGGYALALGER